MSLAIWWCSLPVFATWAWSWGLGAGSPWTSQTHLESQHLFYGLLVGVTDTVVDEPALVALAGSAKR